MACRSSSSDADEKKVVDEIINGVDGLGSGTNVVLYFHGGLSSQKYVEEKLGEKLLESEFDLPEVKKQLYPIFLNYDAEPSFDSVFAKHTNTIITSEAIKRLEEDIKLALGVSKGGSVSSLSEEDLSIAAANVIYKFGNIDSKTIWAVRTENEEKHAEYFINILEAKDLPREFRRESAATAPLNEMALKLGDIVKSSKANGDKQAVQSATETVASTEMYKLRILRIFARIALKNDHGFPATIQEEILDYLFKSGDTAKFSLARNHWDTVKTHSQQCFSEGSSGRELIIRLFKLQEAKKFKVNTLSHSAGAITTSELINYLGESNKGKLNTVVMIVPAVSQKIFSELVIPNSSAFDSLYVYALTEEKERKGHVINKWIYSASLLYGVSSLGERGKLMDKMMLIDQHMKSGRNPYRFPLYQRAACEKPSKLWSYFSPNGKAKFILYPDGVEKYSEAATHENTKYPWVAQDLAHQILKNYEVKGLDGYVFKEPKED